MQRYCKDKIYVNLCQKSTDLNKGNEMKESSDAKKKKITKLGRDYKQVFICLSLEKPSVLQFQCFRTGIPGCIKQDQQTIQ